MLEFVIAVQAFVIIALVGAFLAQQARLFRVAMSRTPGEFRAAEKAARKPAPSKPQAMVELDEATALVLQSVQEGPGTMPHGLGGS